eukprot:TRINITY_DN55_c0_g1_i4.p1 TRINITY_DN55_c0_g1~~TRINITY_DN55_c0_g1_i4.p1  ORF type:complete len:1317 (-),score=358.61 TRINITY_DN55_c0_g1_i4:43-3993(-)
MKLNKASLVLLCSAFVWLASATHFRYGLITWDQTVPSSSGVQFSLSIQEAWRWSYFGNPAVNSTLTSGSIGNQISFNTGGQGTLSPTYTVNSVNSANDWFIIVASGVTATFSGITSTGQILASSSGCCRISSLQNNHDGNWRHTAYIYVSKNGNYKSIKASMVPITTLIVNKPSTFSVNTIKYQNEILSYRLATDVEASSCSGCWYPPSGLSIDYNTGSITWQPTTTGLYTVQVVIKGNTAAVTSSTDTSSLQSYIALDWILQVIDTTSKYCKRFCSNFASFCANDGMCTDCTTYAYTSRVRVPYCDTNTPPYFTQVRRDGVLVQKVTRDQSNSVYITATYQSLLTLQIDTGDDDTEDYITIGTAAVPAGVSVVQTLNAEGNGTATLTWTPGDNDLGGAVICFTASDSLGFNTVGSLCLVITVGQGTLSASGDGLVNAIAGSYTTFSVFNVANRTHSLSFQGVGSTYSGSVVDLYSTSFINSIKQENYQGRYNLIVSGIYVLTVADTTSGLALKPASVVSVLTVIPNVTYPGSCSVYEQGSTGLTGGLVNTQVNFYLHAFDAFGNAQSQQRTDMFYFTLTYYNTAGVSTTTTTNMNWNPITSGGVSDYRYNGSYQIPALAYGNSTYTLNVYYKASGTGSATLVATKNPAVISKGFVCNLQSPTLIAGKAISIQFGTSGLSSSDASSKTFTASVNGVTATVTYAGSGTDFILTAPALTFTAAGFYSRGIVLSATGLGSATDSTSNSTGTVYVDFVGINDAPNVNMSSVSARDSQNIYNLNVNELVASETQVTIVVDLFDQYGNPCTVGSMSVAYTTLNAAGVSITGTALESSNRQLFYFFFTPNVAGAFTIGTTVTYSMTDGSSGSFSLSTISGTVNPGVFSVSQSSYSPVSSTDRDTVAGITKFITVTARDYLYNKRKTDADSFNATLTRAKYGNTPSSSYAMPYQQVAAHHEQYIFGYTSTITGSYTAQINVLDSTVGASGFVNFASLPLTMWAGKLYQSKITAVDADNVKFNTRAEIVIQSQDIYNNTIEDLTGGRYIDPADTTYTVQTYSNVTQAYIVEVSSTNRMIWTLYMAGYCPKTGTKPTKCPTSFLESSTDEQEDEDEDDDDSFVNGVKYKKLSATDQNLYAEGFFRVFYRVPRALFYTNYTVNVYLLNTQKSGNSSSWRARVNDSSTVLVKSFVFNVVPSNEADNQTQTLSVAVVIGAAAGCFFVSGVGYGAFRLSRYRPKYKEAKKEADENEQILEEMRDEGNIAGGRDYMAVGGAVVTMNPLHETYQVEHQQRAGFVQAQNPALKAGEHEAFGEDVEAPLRPSGM